MNKKYLLSFLLVVFATALFAQGIIESPLTSNPVLIQKHDALVRSGMLRSGGSITDTLTLGTAGFLEDFSKEGPYPDTAKWLDNSVFISRDLPVAPITLGAATFDGVKASGYPYNFSALSGSTGKADTLTSKPINLYYPGDTSMFFSFYYQAQGRGNYPEAADSLILEFKSPTLSSNYWKHVWATKGTGAPLSADSTWKLVMLQITDPDLLQNGFQFRFTNWATLSGNGDHWCVDYIYLKNNRSAADTIFNDVAFVYNTPSMIKEYTAVPWKQYDSTLVLSDSVYSTTIRNNNPNVIFGTFGYNIYDTLGTPLSPTYSAGGLVWDPYTAIGYDTCTNSSKPKLNYLLQPPLTGKTKYTIESFIGSGTTPNIILPSDTVRHTQNFDNYFAYDDGTAESSVGLAGFAHAQLAQKFKLNVSDTLRAIDVYFNPQWTNAALYTFKFKVFLASSGGQPGVILYTSPDTTPVYTQIGHDHFTRYELSTPIYLNGGSEYFIGTEQNTTQPINIGLDKNTNSRTKTYYNMTGSWSQSPYAGSLMMRPIFGTAADIVGITDPADEKTEFVIYPNPANDELHVAANISDKDRIDYLITDIFGRVVASKTMVGAQTIDLSDLSAGIYFIRMNSGKTTSTQKFIISK